MTEYFVFGKPLFGEFLLQKNYLYDIQKCIIFAKNNTNIIDKFQWAQIILKNAQIEFKNEGKQFFLWWCEFAVVRSKDVKKEKVYSIKIDKKSDFISRCTIVRSLAILQDAVRRWIGQKFPPVKTVKTPACDKTKYNIISKFKHMLVDDPSNHKKFSRFETKILNKKLKDYRRSSDFGQINNQVTKPIIIFF